MSLLRDGRYYDALHSFMERDIDYWRVLAGTPPCRVLELGCGTGRVAIPLARDGHAVTGIDMSDSMLDVARTKAASTLHQPQATSTPDVPSTGSATFVQRDMRDFAFEPLDLVIAPFNAMRLLLERVDVERMLACVRRTLRSGGRFAFDVTAPRPDELVPELPVTTRNHIDPIDGAPIVATHVRRYDRFRQLITLDASFRFADGRTDTDHIVQRVYFPQELVALLTYNGFDIVDMFGDYDRRPATADAQQLLFVATARTD